MDAEVTSHGLFKRLVLCFKLFFNHLFLRRMVIKHVASWLATPREVLYRTYSAVQRPSTPALFVSVPFESFVFLSLVSWISFTV